MNEATTTLTRAGKALRYYINVPGWGHGVVRAAAAER